jgi:hypothetical protein
MENTAAAVIMNTSAKKSPTETIPIAENLWSSTDLTGSLSPERIPSAATGKPGRKIPFCGF